MRDPHRLRLTIDWRKVEWKMELLSLFLFLVFITRVDCNIEAIAAPKPELIGDYSTVSFPGFRYITGQRTDYIQKGLTLEQCAVKCYQVKCAGFNFCDRNCDPGHNGNHKYCTIMDQALTNGHSYPTDQLKTYNDHRWFHYAVSYPEILAEAGGNTKWAQYFPGFRYMNGKRTDYIRKDLSLEICEDMCLEVKCTGFNYCERNCVKGHDRNQKHCTVIENEALKDGHYYPTSQIKKDEDNRWTHYAIMYPK